MNENIIIENVKKDIEGMFHYLVWGRFIHNGYSHKFLAGLDYDSIYDRLVLGIIKVYDDNYTLGFSYVKEYPAIKEIWKEIEYHANEIINGYEEVTV